MRKAGMVHRHHHRHRRFRVRPEALGMGYLKQDLPRILAKTSADPSTQATETEIVSEPNRLARKGLRACLIALALVAAYVFQREIGLVVIWLINLMRP